MTQLEQKLIVPAAVMQKLESVRGRTLWVRICTALLAAIGVFLVGMGIAMLVDWLAVLHDSSWRMVLTASTIIAAVATLAVLVLIARRKSHQIDRVAAQVDQEIPQLEERWTTVAGISRPDHANHIHPAMFKQVAQEANEWSPKVEVGQVVPSRAADKSLDLPNCHHGGSWRRYVVGFTSHVRFATEVLVANSFNFSDHSHCRFNRRRSRPRRIGRAIGIG